MHRTFASICALGATLALASAASATTQQLQASKDNTLYEQASGTLSNGAGSFFFAGRIGTGEIRRGVIAFDLSSIPHDAVVTGVTLRLHMSQSVSGATPVTLKRALASWGEGTSDAPGAEGGGTGSTTGDATWIHRFFNTTFWAAAGGDFVPATSATQTVADTTFYSWSGAGLVADVQQWIDTPATNFGWVVLGDETTVSTAKRFDSRQNAVTVVRPVLTVDYDRTLPATSPRGLAWLTVALLGAGVVTLRARRRAARA